MSNSVVLDYVIVGAGPAGMQIGYFLGKQGREYLILEAGSVPGVFFERFPRHRKLISINKRFTGYEDPELNLRWDWNSLLSDDPELRFTHYSEEYFPPADDLVRYMADFAQRFDLRIQYDTRVMGVSRGADGIFEVEDQAGNSYRCRRLIVATGMFKQYRPDVPGIEHAELYSDMTLDRDDFANQRVLVIGKGNSGFETADHLVPTASLIHLISPNPIQFAWKTHYVGHLRAVNNNVLDTYQLKSQNALLDAEISKIRRLEDGRLGVEVVYAHAHGEVEELIYDRILLCAGFRFDDSIFDDSCRPQLIHKNRFPEMTSRWESVNVPDLYFVGVVMHSRDFKKKQSGFIHGFRYNIEVLSRMLAESYHDEPLPYTRLEDSPEAVADALLNESNTSSAIWQQTEYLGTVAAREEGELRLYRELPEDYVHERFAQCDEYYYLYLNFGQEIIDSVPDIFAINRLHKDDFQRAEISTGLHPIIHRCSRGDVLATHHVIEDLFSEWKQAKHRDPLAAWLQAKGLPEASQMPAEMELAGSAAGG